MQTINRNVFQQVKKTFKKFSFSTNGEKEINPLVIMNLPVLVGRRDAAYKRAAYLLREHIFSYPEQQRSKIYVAVLTLLSIAIEATESIAPGLYSMNRRASKRHDTEPILSYLLLLNDTVSAASALVNHELILFKDEKELSSFIGSEISLQFITAEEVFSNSEMNIYNLINDLIDLAEPAIKRYRDQQKRSFSKADLGRYKKSMAEFSSLYDKVGKIDEPPNS